jgi:predicted adenine nucleotide alpha hydrolase (AANH) superfamily ATPase
MKSVYFRLLFLAAILSLACTTKVSEWVLLNASPEQYTLVYFHNTPVNETIRMQNANIGKEIKPANIQFRSLEKKDIERPYYALYYENRLFARYDDYRDLRGLTSSPLREKIASEILSGRLCVLLYLKTDTREKDEKGLQVLNKALGLSPYKDIITVIELSKNDIAESHFISLLLNVEDDLKAIPEPMLFGIFGRFKALEPLLGKGITEENINLMIDFLTADCSCLIQDNLPGTDILFTNMWDNPATALVNKILDDNPSLLHH